MLGLLMITGVNSDFFMYLFTAQTLIGQIFLMAWMGNTLTETVKTTFSHDMPEEKKTKYLYLIIFDIEFDRV